MKQNFIPLRTLGMMLLLVLFTLHANAQNIKVTGTVNDNLGPVLLFL